MPTERVSMRRVREILRLKYEVGATDRAVARAGGVARSTALASRSEIGGERTKRGQRAGAEIKKFAPNASP